MTRRSKRELERVVAEIDGSVVDDRADRGDSELGEAMGALEEEHGRETMLEAVGEAIEELYQEVRHDAKEPTGT